MAEQIPYVVPFLLYINYIQYKSTSIKQGCIKLIKSDSKDIQNVTEDF